MYTHKNTKEPQTLECAFGLKADDGKYYGLDFNLSSHTPSNFKVGQKITANGVVNPIETLSTDFWQKYPIEGIFYVTDSIEVNN